MDYIKVTSTDLTQEVQVKINSIAWDDSKAYFDIALLDSEETPLLATVGYDWAEDETNTT
ncbi:MAG: hypothetical protein LBJ36_10660 [Synergistaceae bacterium]|jgi:hypothetical protein|nr:hypothetical protein [Synergistaceae bacterium]